MGPLQSVYPSPAACSGKAGFAHPRSTSSLTRFSVPFFGRQGITPSAAGQSPFHGQVCMLGSHAPALGQLPSHGVSSPSALEVSKVHSTRACLTRYGPLPGFLSLLGAFSSRYPPALFRAGSALGVLPSGLFPPSDTELFRAALPSCRWSLELTRLGLRLRSAPLASPRVRARVPSTPGSCSPTEAAP